MDEFTLNLEKLEERADFRAEELYFIRLSNAYIAGIFWDAFSGNNKNRRRKLYEIANELEETHRHLKAAILPNESKSGKRENPILDCLGGVFVNQIIRRLPEDIIQHFEEVSLRYNHGIFLRVLEDHNRPFNMTFSKALEVLYRRRNYLEHYGDPIKLNSNGKPKEKLSETAKYNLKRQNNEWNYSDAMMVEALSYFLLPELLHQFAGRVAYYERKIGTSSQSSNAAIIREIIRDGVAKRRANNKSLFGVARTKSHMKDKAKRKATISNDIPWRAAHLLHKQHVGKATDYREHEFKLRFYFIGANNIRAIKAYLAPNNPNQVFHFKRDIEAFYILSAKINFHIHMGLSCVPRKPDNSLIGDNEDETLKLNLLRNIIAHNGLFWNLKIDDKLFEAKDIFALVCRKLLRYRGLEAGNQFYDRIKQLLRDENFSIIDIKGDKTNEIPPKTLHISRWTKQMREKYLKSPIDGVAIDRRNEFRKRAAILMQSLDSARKPPLE